MRRYQLLVLCFATAVLGAYPFNRIVAFGDNLSDNGNGSYAHGVANPNNKNDKIYGYGTWTNGPVAVSYLSTLLKVPLTADYAFGHANGGSKIGATINNSYTTSMYAPDAFTQVRNYTSTPKLLPQTVRKTLHFVWIGNNDVSLKHISVNSPTNPNFAAEMAQQMGTLVGRLIKAGAQHVFVPGIYPRNLSASRKYLCQNQLQIENLALAIAQANRAIKSKLAQLYGKKVIYYDAFAFMTSVYNKHDSYGIKYVLPYYCDGYSQKDYKRCLVQGFGDEYYWVQQTDPTTRIHSLLAQDMAKTIKAAFK